MSGGGLKPPANPNLKGAQGGASGFSQSVVSTETVVLQCGDQRFQEVARENVGRSTIVHLATGSRPSVRPSVRRYRRYHWCVSVVTSVTPP